jgi:pimeloyl-ACP methyl ester carboxylesterase
MPRPTSSEPAAGAPGCVAAAALAASAFGPAGRLTNEDVDIASRNDACDFLVDRIHPGHPLIISFNYFTQRDYDFFGRVRKLEQRLGLPFNRVMLRDSHHAWYQRGVTGLGDSVDAVVASLRAFIADMRPSKIITVGQSMGAYAAAMIGMLLDADQVIAYGALSHLDLERTRQDGDVRWMPLIEMLARNPPPRFYDDLPALARTRTRLPAMHMIAGTRADGSGGMPNLDALHAARFAALPAVIPHDFPLARHEVSIWLLEHGLLDDMLHQIVAPLCAAAPFSAFKENNDVP